MSTLMQKPWFVALLSLVAIGAVYVNVVQPILGNNRVAASGPAVALQATSVSPSLPVKGVERHKNTDWVTLKSLGVSGNPFYEFSAVSLVLNPPVGVSPAKGVEVAWPHISAVAITSAGKYAVVGSHVMHEGETVNSFKLQRVTGQYVILSYEHKSKRIMVQSMRSGDE